MRTIVRLFLIPGFILFLVLFLHTLAARSAFSEQNIKRVVSTPQLYESLAASIQSHVEQTSEDGIPFSLSGNQIQGVVAPYIEGSVGYITGTRGEPPTFTSDDILKQVFKGNPDILQEISTMKETVATTEIQSGEEMNLAPLVKELSGPKNVGITNQLQLFRKLYATLSYLPWVFLGSAVIIFVLILLLSPNARSRVLWVSFLSLLVAVTFAIGTVFYGFSTTSFTFMSPRDSSEILSTLSTVFLLPLFDTLARWNKVGAIIAGCLAIIFFLARFMLFPKAVAIQEQRNVKKEKKVVVK